MNRNTLRRSAVVPAAIALALGLVGCGAQNEPESGGSNSGLSGTVQGAGASSQEAAMEAWTAGFTKANPDVTINYNPIGSGGGRTRFVDGASAFGASDEPLDDEELAGAKKRCGEVVEIPAYISPIAVAFNLPGVDKLNLRPETIANIFNGKITNWNDQAIARDNPNAKLPNLRITPVNRSDESGTTENFQDYLSKAAGNAWPHEVSGDWPVKGGEAAQGTSGVVDAVKAGNGTIGYADASQIGDLGTANVGVGKEFVSYSPEAAAKVLESSKRIEGRGKYSFAYELARDTAKSGTYPIVLVSYELACQSYPSAEQANAVKAFFNYIVSPEGQQLAAKQSGSAPISDSLRQQIKPAIDAISAKRS